MEAQKRGRTLTITAHWATQRAGAPLAMIPLFFRRLHVWPLLALFWSATALFTFTASADDAPRAGIVAPSRIDEEPMPYPDGATGDAVVVLELEIERDGRVGSASVQEGQPPFAEAARRSAITWRFTPATRNGLPIRARILA